MALPEVELEITNVVVQSQSCHDSESPRPTRGFKHAAVERITMKHLTFIRSGTITLAMAVSSQVLSAQTVQRPKPSPEKKILLTGRVLAWTLPLSFGAGVGPLYEQFVFGIEHLDWPPGDGRVRLTPIKIEYAFFTSDGPLPDRFFDYSKHYELQVVRDTRCDESIESLSYVKSVDHESGKPLPPLYVLRFLDGAPRDALKPDEVLACYILRPGRYRVLSEKERKDQPKPIKP